MRYCNFCMLSISCWSDVEIEKSFINVDDIDRELAKREHVEFMRYCWTFDKKKDPFIVGRHTKVICDKIDNAIASYRKGRSVFLILTIPFRHGKSQIVSRYLPPRILGLFKNIEVLVGTYGADLSHDLSRDSRAIVDTETFREVFPDIKLSSKTHSVEKWDVEPVNRKDKVNGKTRWAGVGGAITGKGYHFGIIDDYLKNRDDAESAKTRDRQWDWFTQAFFTRRAPVSVTIILATPWHIDDIIGRIKKKNDPDSEDYEPDFPVFEVISFPAVSDKYENKYLFPERFPEQWYKQQFASLGKYASAGLLQCNPVIKEGGRLDCSRIKIVDSFPDGLRWARIWDLASTSKQQLKQDPDYTVGGLLAVGEIENDEGVKVPAIYIRDLVRGQWSAPKRDPIILQTAQVDGDTVKVGIEAIAGYKDTYENLASILRGLRTVEQISPAKDKITRAEPLEPIFQAGNIYLKRAEWNRDLIRECSEFPSGSHDDIVDVISNGYTMLKQDTAIVTKTFSNNMKSMYTEKRNSVI